MTWEEALDEFERRMQAMAEAALVGEEVVMGEWETPTAPMPESLALRAEKLQRDAEALVVAVEGARKVVLEQIAGGARVGDTARAEARVLDQRG